MDAKRKAEVKERLRKQIQDDLSRSLDAAGALDENARRKQIAEAVDERTAYMTELDEADRSEMKELMLNEFLSFGPLQEYLDDPTVTEVMVNGHENAYVERGGKITKVAGEGTNTPFIFADDDAVRRVINRILLPLGRRCDEQMPMVDARLPDGSRVNAIIPPCSLNGPCITVRKFATRELGAEDYIETGSASPEMMMFLTYAVASKCNVLVSGSTGSGKTTLLNALSKYIPAGERIVVIEDSHELKLEQEHVLYREARPANSEGKGEISIDMLLVNALRERPDRIIVGECRSREAITMLQAMNTGHDGSMTTVHANDPMASFERIVTMVSEASNLQDKTIRRQIASAIHIVVQISRFHDGSRKIEDISAIAGMEGETIVLQKLFEYVPAGIDEYGRVVGKFKATGFLPPKPVLTQFQIAGYSADTSWFRREGAM